MACLQGGASLDTRYVVGGEENCCVQKDEQECQETSDVEIVVKPVCKNERISPKYPLSDTSVH